MAEGRSVTVLTPNGGRPNIKVTINTTLLEVLEEACRKHDFNPDEYDLKHFNKILDLNLTIRYGNISNKACLEMVKCKIPRKVSDAIICIQLENGDRHTAPFPPSENLENIMKKFNIEYNKDSAVIIYTQREIHGKDFETITLRSLGIGNGKALCRLLHRDPKKLKEQAHVYVPPTPKVPKTEYDEDERPRPSPIVDPFKSKFVDPIAIIKAENKDCTRNQDDMETEKDSENKSKITNVNNFKVEKEGCSTNLIAEKETPMEVNNKNEMETNQNVKEIIKEEPKIEFLGERNALLFHQADAKVVPQDDIPDNFFDLTVKDAKTLLRGVKKTLAKLEDSPLQTAAQRELEEDNEKLYRLHKYQQSIIRIQFPNQLVLQGLFTPLEKVQTVKDFIKTYLERPDSDFTLYTAPPRCDLNPEGRLFDLDLVPTAIVYFSGSSDLRPDIKLKLTDPTAASMHATRTRLRSMRQDGPLVDDNDQPGPSTSGTALFAIKNNSCPTEPEPVYSRTQQSSNTAVTEPSQVPKWFKLPKK